MVIDFLEKKLQRIEQCGLDRLVTSRQGLYPSGHMLLVRTEYDLLRQKNARYTISGFDSVRDPEDPRRSGIFPNIIFIDLGQTDYLDRFFRI